MLWRQISFGYEEELSLWQQWLNERILAKEAFWLLPWVGDRAWLGSDGDSRAMLRGEGDWIELIYDRQISLASLLVDLPELDQQSGLWLACEPKQLPADWRCLGPEARGVYQGDPLEQEVVAVVQCGDSPSLVHPAFPLPMRGWRINRIEKGSG